MVTPQECLVPTQTEAAKLCTLEKQIDEKLLSEFTPLHPEVRVYAGVALSPRLQALIALRYGAWWVVTYVKYGSECVLMFRAQQVPVMLGPAELNDRLLRYGYLAANPYRSELEEHEVWRLQGELQARGVALSFEPAPREYCPANEEEGS